MKLAFSVLKRHLLSIISTLGTQYCKPVLEISALFLNQCSPLPHTAPRAVAVATYQTISKHQYEVDTYHGLPF